MRLIVSLQPIILPSGIDSMLKMGIADEYMTGILCLMVVEPDKQSHTYKGQHKFEGYNEDVYHN